MPLTRFLRRVSLSLEVPDAIWPVSMSFGTGIGKKYGWSLQRVEWRPRWPELLDVQRPQVLDGNYGFGHSLTLYGAKMLYNGGVYWPWTASGVAIEHTWSNVVWPVVYEFPKGTVTVDETLTVDYKMVNMDLATGGVYFDLFYTVLELTPDDSIFLRSFQ